MVESAPPSLWPVIVGGAIGVAGTAVASLIAVLNKRLELRDAKTKERAKKFEEFVEIVYQFDHWVEREGNVLVHGQNEEIGISPLAKLRAIATVHFPDLNSAISQLEIEYGKFRQWMLRAARKRVENSLANVNNPSPTLDPDITAGHEGAYRPYIETREILLLALRNYARDGFHPSTPARSWWKPTNWWKFLSQG